MNITKFEDMPNGIKVLATKAVGNVRVKSWVNEKIPALGNFSIIEILNGGENGEREVRVFLHECIARNMTGYP